MTLTQMKPAVTHAPESKPVRKTLRLINTKDLPRNEWLDTRKRGIGSSDAAAAVGLNPYKSQLELWMEKTGRDSNLPKIDPQDETSPTYWGNLLEPIVAAHYTKRTGRRVRRVNAVLQCNTFPWMLANIDREVLSSDEVQILECKTTGINGAKLWRDGVPEYVQIQVMHQLIVTGKWAADVAVLIGGQELQIHRIQRDPPLLEKLIELERAFWEYVETDTPPPADGSDSAERALRCLYPSDSGAVVDFSEDRQMSALFSDLVNVRETINRDSELESALKQKIQARMGEASRAIFETGEVTWKRSKDSTVLDVSALSAEHPELAQQYVKTKSGSRRFLIIN